MLLPEGVHADDGGELPRDFQIEDAQTGFVLNSFWESIATCSLLQDGAGQAVGHSPCEESLVRFPSLAFDLLIQRLACIDP